MRTSGCAIGGVAGCTFAEVEVDTETGRVNPEWDQWVLEHVAQLLEDDLSKTLEGAELIVVTQKNKAYGRLMDVVKPDQHVDQVLEVLAHA